MHYRKFGNTGLEVSEVGFGTWPIGGTHYGRTDDYQSIRALQHALELGINYFDTSDIYGYGRSERLVAKAFKGKRDKVIIASKAGYILGGQGWGPPLDDPPLRCFSKTYIKGACEASLLRLETDYIDVYQIHDASLEIYEKPENYEAMEELKAEGKIRFYGVSIGPAAEGFGAMNAAPISSIQAVYNIFIQDIGKELFPEAARRGVAIVARVPMASGFLSGSITKDTVFPEFDRRRNFARERILQAIQKAEALKFLIKGNTKTLAQAALKFILSNPDVTLVIPGAMTEKEVEDNAAASDGVYLSEEDLQRIDELYKKNFGTPRELKSRAISGVGG